MQQPGMPGMNGPQGVNPGGHGANDEFDVSSALNMYILDYLKKRDFHQAANAFKMEAKISDRPVGVDYPGGFLYEWWVVFWEIFNTRSNQSYSEAASKYLEIQRAKQQQQLLQLQLHQTIQQRKMASQEGLRHQGSMNMGNMPSDMLKMDPSGKGPGGINPAALAAVERANSLQGGMSGGTNRAMLAALSGMNPGATGSPTVTAQGMLSSQILGQLGPRGMPGMGGSGQQEQMTLQRLRQAQSGSLSASAMRSLLGDGPDGFMEGGGLPHPAGSNSPVPGSSGPGGMLNSQQTLQQMLQQQQQQQQRQQLLQGLKPKLSGSGAPSRMASPNDQGQNVDRQAYTARLQQLQRMHSQQQQQQQLQQQQHLQQQQQHQGNMGAAGGANTSPDGPGAKGARGKGAAAKAAAAAQAASAIAANQGGSRKRKNSSQLERSSSGRANSPSQAGTPSHNVNDGPGGGLQGWQNNNMQMSNNAGNQYAFMDTHEGMQGNGLLDGLDAHHMEDLLHTDFDRADFDAAGLGDSLLGPQEDAPLADSLLGGLGAAVDGMMNQNKNRS